MRLHLEQSETTMIDEAQDAATRFRFSGTKGLPCTAASFVQTSAAACKGRHWAAGQLRGDRVPRDATLK